MRKKDNYKIIYIDEFGEAIDKKELKRVIFVGENQIFRKIKIKKTVFPFIMFLFTFTLVFSGFKIYMWQNDGVEALDKNIEYIELAEIIEEEIKEEHIIETIKTEKKVSSINNSYYWKFNNVTKMKVNFEKLLNINDETAAWLYVPGTKINYPVTHTTNNEFYLDHTFDKSSNSVGWVFLDYRNNGLLTDRNNVVYAHGRLDNIMFGTLKNVLEKGWYTDESNRILKTSTPTHSDLWEVFSIYTIKSESYYITTGFQNNLDYYNFIKKMTSRSIYDFGITVSTTDKLLTLSTCLNDHDQRIVLHARLVLSDNMQ